jgi:diguanylate cyclase (GGDEF)-like protein
VWAHPPGDAPLTGPAWPPELADPRPRFHHWFARTPAGLLELRAAPVQPDDDKERRTRPRGWFVFGQLWSDQWRQRMEEITTTVIRLDPAARVEVAKPPPGIVRFLRPLPGWGGEPVATAVVEGVVRGAAEAASRSRIQSTFLAAGAGTTILLIVWALIAWVYRPIRALARAVTSGDAGELASMDRAGAEFARAAAALRIYFGQQGELERLARHDALTGLPNRALLHDRLCVALARAERDGRPLALLVMDLDGFKAVNDTLGHEAGDATLKLVAERLSGLLRQGDTVARIGGDEFVALLPVMSGPADAEIVARRIVEAVGQPFFLGANDVHIGVSVGIAVCPEDGGDPEALLKAGDRAMYRAKEQGKNRYARASEIRNSQALERAAFELDLRAALVEDALEIRYRPRIDLADGTTTALCLEALWRRSGSEAVPLSRVRREIEETGLTEVVGAKLLEIALGDAAARRAEGTAPPRVSLLLCRHRFFRPGMAERLAEAVAAAGLEPRALELRVPEAVLALRPDEAGETLRRLGEAGFGLALDGFGAGRASLALLRDLPFHAVCIGPEVVGGLVDGSPAAALLSAVVTMARSLGRPRVVADGVDTAERLALVRRFGCHEAEGPAVAASPGG